MIKLCTVVRAPDQSQFIHLYTMLGRSINQRSALVSHKCRWFTHCDSYIVCQPCYYRSSSVRSVHCMNSSTQPLSHWPYCLLARDAFFRTNRRAVAVMFVCLSETGVHCDHTVHFSMGWSLQLDTPVFWGPWHQSMSTYS